MTRFGHRSLHLKVALVAAFFSVVTACGGGSSTPTPPVATYTANSGVAQKGPLVIGSAVVAQELNASLSPTGKQYSYQTTSAFGTFSPSNTFMTQYVGVNATGYYFDEVQNAVSSGPVTLNGFSDLSSETVLNVNLLTTLEFQRIQNLVTKSNMTFSAARAQAESEILKALNIPVGSYGAFSTLDISGNTDGDHILAAISTIFVYGNSAGTLSQLIANFQSDIGTNGVITNDKTMAALVAAAESINPATVAANLTQEYASQGLTFTAANISDWIALSGDGVIGKFSFQVPDATPSTIFTFPASVASQFAGTPVSVTAGTLSVNGNPVSGTVTFNTGAVLTLSPGAGAFPNGLLTAFLVSGSTNLARVSFVSDLVSIAVTPSTPSVPKGLTQQFTAIGTFSDTSTADLTGSTTWTSGASSIATVGANSGLANALTTGSTAITATSGSLSGSATITVSPAIVESIAITPNPVVTATGLGANTQITATGTYSDGTTQNVTTAANWTTGTPSVATVGPSTGLATGVSAGSTTITASIGSITATMPLWVVSNVYTLPSTSPEILAVSDTNFLYSPDNLSVHLLSGSTDTTLSMNISDVNYWTVTNNGYVFGSLNNVYMWPQGSSTATTLASGSQLVASNTSDEGSAPSVHFPWVLWINTAYTQYTLYNVLTSQQFAIPAPAGVTRLGNGQTDFTMINGQLALFFEADSQGTSGITQYNIYVWNQATEVSTQISTDGLSFSPKTDGTWVAWQTNQVGPQNTVDPPYTLSLLNIESNTTTALSQNMFFFQPSSGIVGWQDIMVGPGPSYAATSSTIKAFDGTTTTTISIDSGNTGAFIGCSGGYIVIVDMTTNRSWNLFAWSPAGGRQLIFSFTALPKVFLGGKTIYFMNSDQPTLYSVTLP